MRLAIFLLISFATSLGQAQLLSVPDAQAIIRSIDAFNDRGNPLHPDHCGAPVLPAVALKDNPLCQQHLKYLESKAEESITPTAMVDRLAYDKSQVFLIGDTHLSPVEENFHRILIQLKASHPDLNCLFLEYPPSYQGLINSLASGTEVEGTGRELAPAMLRNLLFAAKAAGIKMIAVDDEDGSRAETLTTDVLQSRNEVMTARIQSHLADGSCKKAAFVVGAAHLYKTAGYDSVEGLLGTGGIHTTSLLPIDTGCSTLINKPNLFWSREGCADQPENQTTEFAFANTAGGPPDEHWSDFNYTWVYPSKFDYDCQPMH